MVEKEKEFYHFRHNTRSVKSTIVHFQVSYFLTTAIVLSFALYCFMWKIFTYVTYRRSRFHCYWVLKILDWHYAGVDHIFCFSLACCLWVNDDQLRNLVWATSKHDVYLMHSYSVMHWSPLTRKGTEVLNVAGPVVPALEVTTSVASSLFSIHTFILSTFWISFWKLASIFVGRGLALQFWNVLCFCALWFNVLLVIASSCLVCCYTLVIVSSKYQETRRGHN